MAYQLSEIVTDVQNKVDDSGFSSTLIKQFINDAQREVFNRYKLRFMEASQAYTLTVGVDDITDGNGLPSNYQSPRHLLLTTANQELFIPNIDNSTFLKMYPGFANDDNSKPFIWWEDGSTINVYPAPDSAYTVTLYYYKNPAELSSDSDVPELPEEFQEVLLLGAIKRVQEYNDDYDLAQLTASRQDELLQDVVRRYGQRVHGRVHRMRTARG